MDVVAPERRLDPHVPHDVEGLGSGVRRLVGGGEGHRPAEGVTAIDTEAVQVSDGSLERAALIVRHPL